MLHICAVSFTRLLYKHCNLPVDRRAVYIYGVELFFSTALAAISILMISFWVGKITSGILFILIFVSLRVFVGGFHASTYRNCFLLTNSVFLATLVGSTLLEKYKLPIQMLSLIPFIGAIWMLAPISNIHHPLSVEAYKNNKKVGRILVGTESLISISIDLFIGRTDLGILPITSASIAAVAVMMIIPKIIERRGTYLG